MEYMFNGPLGPSGTFFLFAGFSAVGSVLYGVCLKETMGLSEFEKKNIYCPKGLQDTPVNTLPVVLITDKV